jgi:predicted ABC-type ATPase
VASPVLHLIAGPNGAGKTTFYEEILAPAMRLPFLNADHIAATGWPGAEMEHAYEAAKLAAKERQRYVAARRSFVTETVFSHPSKVEFLRSARAAGYLTTLHAILIPEELAVARVAVRVETGGHAVPEDKIRDRYARLWGLVREAIPLADEATVYDNSRAAHTFRVVAHYLHGRPVSPPEWPPWAPAALTA